MCGFQQSVCDNVTEQIRSKVDLSALSFNGVYGDFHSTRDNVSGGNAVA